MNKKLYTICAIAAAFVLAGCQKEINNEPTYVGPTHTVTFTVEKAGDTKTAIASEGDGVVSYKWIDGDKERMHIYEKGPDAIKPSEGTITSMTLENDDKIATFAVTFDGDAPTGGDVVYSATYGGKVSGGCNPLIPAEQFPGVNTFDPNADALIAEEIVISSEDQRPSSFKFKMNRVVSVNKMTLKGLPNNTVIKSVTIESDQYHTGYMQHDGTLPTSGNGKKIYMFYSENNTFSSASGFPVYFTTAPVTNASFKVTVNTSDGKRYVKSPTSTISFATGKVRRFNIDLTNCEAPAGRVFTLVESVDDLVIGNNIVIAENGVNNHAMSIEQKTNNRGETDVTKSDDRKTLTITEQVQIFVLESGLLDNTYAFHCVNGDNAGYLYAASSTDNYLRTESELDENGSWTITIDGEEALITAQGTNTRNVLRHNSQSSIFSCYQSGKQQAVYLYQASSLPSPEMSWSVETANATLTSSGIEFDEPILSKGYADDVTYSSSNQSVATITAEGEVTILAEGTTVISAIFAGDSSYSPATASYTLHVTDGRETCSTPSFSQTPGEVESGTEVTISTTTSGATIYYTTNGDTPTTSSDIYSSPIVITSSLTIKAIAVKANYKDSDVAIADYIIQMPASTVSQVLASGAGSYKMNNLLVYHINGNNVIVGDTTGKMLLYMSDHGLSNGDDISIISAGVELYNNKYLEITSGNITINSRANNVDHGTPINLNDETVATSTRSIYQSSGYHPALYVSISGSKSGRSITGDHEAVYLNSNNTAYDGKNVNATGYVYYYDGSHGNYNFQLVSIEENSELPYLAVTPESLSWGDSEYGVSSGKTITVTANGNGYSVNGSSNDWTISDDGVGGITVYPNAANSSTSLAKSLTIIITHNDDNTLVETVTCTQSTASTGSDPTIISINFTTTTQRPSGFPETSQAPGTTLATYTIAGYSFSFYAPNAYYWINSNTNNNKYLFLGQSGAYILFPAIVGKKLTKVSFTTGSNASAKVNVGIYSADGNTVIKSPETLNKGTSYDWTITGTTNNTSYQYRVTNKYNSQLTRLELRYE